MQFLIVTVIVTLRYRAQRSKHQRNLIPQLIKIFWNLLRNLIWLQL